MLSTIGLVLPPTNVTVSPLSSTELYVSWKEISTDDVEVTGYEVKYRQLDHIQEGQAQTNRVEVVPSSSVLLGGLRKYTRYNVSIRTLSDQGGSPFSVPVEAQTEEDGKKVRVEFFLRVEELCWRQPWYLTEVSNAQGLEEFSNAHKALKKFLMPKALKKFPVPKALKCPRP